MPSLEALPRERPAQRGVRAEPVGDAAGVETDDHLAAAYRLTHMFGMTTLVYNHITARVPGTKDQFLINEFGLGYNEITASNLVKIDLDGRVLEGTPRINLPGYVIHSAVHAVRHDVNCVMHTHTPYGMAVSALENGFTPLQQDTYGFYDDVAYHEFEGLAVDADDSDNNEAIFNAMLLRLKPAYSTTTNFNSLRFA